MKAVQTDVLIAGAGIIGASTAFRLARGGMRVVLADQGTLGGEASSAAAGMLAPGGEITPGTSWAPLAIESLAMFAGYVSELEAASGLRIDYRRCGAIELAESAAEAEELEARAISQQRLGIASQQIALAEVAARIPGINLSGVTSARYYPDDAIVDPRHIMAALRAACLEAGVDLREGSAVTRVQCSADGVEACAGASHLRGHAAVLAAGAWSNQVEILLDERQPELPVTFPVRGHLAEHYLKPGRLHPILRHRNTYLLQRSDGRLLVGASEEEAGFDRRLDEGTIAEVCRRAAAWLPDLQGREPEHKWLGFRPGTADHAPCIGRLEDAPLWLAYGHYRNGILLAPATAQCLAREITASLGTGSAG